METLIILNSIIGTTITALQRVKDTDAVHIETDTGLAFRIFDRPTTEEGSRYIRSESPLGEYIGAKVLGFKIVEGEHLTFIDVDGEIDDDFPFFESLHLIFRTTEGNLQFEFCNEHHGESGGVYLVVQRSHPMDTNRHGVATEPFRAYMVTTEDNATPVWATRTRNVWNAYYGAFVAYHQHVVSAVLVD